MGSTDTEAQNANLEECHIKNVIKKNKKKCEHCNKKSLMIKICKCGMLLCLKHLNHSEHNCQYDYTQEKTMTSAVKFQKLEKL
jgi:hypothetical protein